MDLIKAFLGAATMVAVIVSLSATDKLSRRVKALEKRSQPSMTVVKKPSIGTFDTPPDWLQEPVTSGPRVR